MQALEKQVLMRIILNFAVVEEIFFIQMSWCVVEPVLIQDWKSKQIMYIVPLEMQFLETSNVGLC